MVFGNNKYLRALFSGYGLIEAKGVRLTPFCFLFLNIFLNRNMTTALYIVSNPISEVCTFFKLVSFWCFECRIRTLRCLLVFLFGWACHWNPENIVLFCVNVGFEVVMYKPCFKNDCLVCVCNVCCVWIRLMTCLCKSVEKLGSSRGEGTWRCNRISSVKKRRIW